MPPKTPKFPQSKGDELQRFPNRIKPRNIFFIPAHFSSHRLAPVPPSDTPDDAMSGEAGPAPGRSTVAGARPRPAATVSLRTWGWNEGLAVGCRQTWIPRSEGRASEAHRQGANAVANIQTAGRTKRRGWTPGRKWPDDHPPGEGPRSVWCTIRREPPGPPARLWQTFREEDSAAAGPAPGHPWNASSKDRRRLARETHAAGQKRRTGRRKEPHIILRQAASGASSETSLSPPGG
jgi:hypothetical protein